MKLPKILTLCLTLAWLATNAVGGTLSQELLSIHPSVGTIIDAEENRRFFLFGENAGFVTAKLYFTSTQKWMLHLFGERNGVFWMQTVRLSSEIKMNLERRIEAAGDVDGSAMATTFATPVHELRTVPTDSIVTIKLLDETTFIGTITSATLDTVRFVTTNGVSMEIPEAKVHEITAPEGTFVGGTFLKYDPNHDRLFFAPTGRTLKAGQVNFSDFYVVFPTLTVGLTDFFMIGGGVSLIPGIDEQLFYFSPKLRFVHQENLDWAAGLLYMGLPGVDDFGSAFTSLTFGTPAGGVTLGLAVPFFFGSYDDDDSGIFAVLIGAEKQLSNRLKLITENWILNTDQANLFFSGGFRFIGDGLTVGFGLFTNSQLDQGFPFIPWLDFSVALGR